MSEATEFIARSVTVADITFLKDCNLLMQTKHVIRREVTLVIYDVGCRPITYDLIEDRCNQAEGDYTYDNPRFTDDIESQAVLSYLLDLFGVDH